ncbi:hypothetical protein [Aquisphaera insulae]|uniref:hypothetical protein n=1 Tax=Aquisphaera insulae TaxID=2712864 RepID=UPI0013EE2EDA|nr:hypothetical protein [Aquisphaera insulae]
MPPPGGMDLDLATCSPWVDELGRFQVVGRLSGTPANSSRGSVGLARISYPDGEILDFIETEAVPTSRPCWLPGPLPRVLYVAGDGGLYRRLFDGARSKWPASDRDEIDNAGRSGQKRLDWRSPFPPGDVAMVLDFTWLRDARFGDILILVIKARMGPEPSDPVGDQLCWARLAETEDAVIDSGPISGLQDATSGRSLRAPSVGRTEDGGLFLAYLSTDRPAAGGWELHAVRLSFEGSGRARIVAGTDVRLAERCSTYLPPALAAGGECLWACQPTDADLGRLVLVALPRDHRGWLRLAGDHGIEPRRSSPRGDRLLPGRIIESGRSSTCRN